MSSKEPPNYVGLNNGDGGSSGIDLDQDHETETETETETDKDTGGHVVEPAAADAATLADHCAGDLDDDHYATNLDRTLAKRPIGLLHKDCLTESVELIACSDSNLVDGCTLDHICNQQKDCKDVGLISGNASTMCERPNDGLDFSPTAWPTLEFDNTSSKSALVRRRRGIRGDDNLDKPHRAHSDDLFGLKESIQSEQTSWLVCFVGKILNSFKSLNSASANSFNNLKQYNNKLIRNPTSMKTAINPTNVGMDNKQALTCNTSVSKKYQTINDFEQFRTDSPILKPSKDIKMKQTGLLHKHSISFRNMYASIIQFVPPIP